MKNYITNGRVAREEIAIDIRDGVLTKDDIKILIENPEIQKAFIGTTYSKKIDRTKWTKDYLYKLPNATIAESFNEDYLFYLADVAEYVRGQNSKISSWTVLHKYWPVTLIVAVTLIGCLILIAISSGN